MSDPRAIAGEFADFKLVKTRSVAQIVVEIPIEQGEQLVRMFGIPQPGKPVKLALARLVEGSVAQLDERHASNVEDAGSSPAGAATSRREWSSLSPPQQAGIRCGEIAFQRFLRENGDAQCDTSEAAATYVRFSCGVRSRADIGKDRASLNKWRDLETAYQAWLRDPVSPEGKAA